MVKRSRRPRRLDEVTLCALTKGMYGPAARRYRLSRAIRADEYEPEIQASDAVGPQQVQLDLLRLLPIAGRQHSSQQISRILGCKVAHDVGGQPHVDVPG